MNHRAMPDAIMNYKCAIQLFKLYNTKEASFEWTILNFNQIFTSSQTVLNYPSGDLSSSVTSTRTQLFSRQMMSLGESGKGFIVKD